MTRAWKLSVVAVSAAILSGGAPAQNPAPSPAEMRAQIQQQILAHPQQYIEGLAQMCETQSITVAPPYGESDIKDSPKLHDYCQCLSGKFGARGLKLAQDNTPPPPAVDMRNQEREMRNSCRQEQGLPAIAFPNK